MQTVSTTLLSNEPTLTILSKTVGREVQIPHCPLLSRMNGTTGQNVLLHSPNDHVILGNLANLAGRAGIQRRSAAEASHLGPVRQMVLNS